MSTGEATNQLRIFFFIFASGIIPIVLLPIRWEMQGADFFVEPGTGVLWGLRIGLAALAGAQLATVRYVSPQIDGARLSWPSEASPEVRAYIARGILGFAFCEAIAVYGLFLYMLGGNLVDVGVFTLVAIVALAWHFPRPPEVRGEQVGGTPS